MRMPNMVNLATVTAAAEFLASWPASVVVIAIFIIIFRCGIVRRDWPQIFVLCALTIADVVPNRRVSGRKDRGARSDWRDQRAGVRHGPRKHSWPTGSHRRTKQSGALATHGGRQAASGDDQWEKCEEDSVHDVNSNDHADSHQKSVGKLRKL